MPGYGATVALRADANVLVVEGRTANVGFDLKTSTVGKGTLQLVRAADRDNLRGMLKLSSDATGSAWSEVVVSGARNADWKALGRRLSIPWVTFIGGMIVMQVVLPNALRQTYDQSGLSQTWKKFTGPWHRDFAAELGWNKLHGTMLLIVFIVVMIGMVLACVRAPGLNLPIAVFAVVSMLVVGTIPAVSPRYLMSITPFAVYFGAQAFALLPVPKRAGVDRKSTRLNSSHVALSRMPSSA